MRAFLTFALFVAAVAATCDNDCEECGPDQLACPGADPTLCPTCIAIHDGTVDNWGNPCHASCPVICGEDEQICGAGPDPWSGCQMSGWCEPTMDPVTECPIHCHLTCGPDEISCPGVLDAAGCHMPDTCMPGKTDIIDNWGNPCWNQCPVVCDEGHQVCGAGIDPWHGCPVSGWCEPLMDWNDCPKHCPVQCGPEEVHCWGGWDGTCNLPDYCSPIAEGCPPQ